MRYDPAAIVLHWLIALVVLGQFALGCWMISLPDRSGVQAAWYNTHKSLGLTLALLALARLAWRSRRPPPALPTTMPAWQQRAARWTHGGLYACSSALPRTGYLGSSFSGYPIRYFGLALPNWGWKWPAAKLVLGNLHLALNWLLGALVFAHVAAALVHLARRDGLFQRMLPAWTRP